MADILAFLCDHAYPSHVSDAFHAVYDFGKHNIGRMKKSQLTVTVLVSRIMVQVIQISSCQVAF